MLLAIETGYGACSVALIGKDDVIDACHELIGRGHAERLLPLIEALLGGRVPTAIAVDVGPGSFTGLRVGIAAARALALAWGVPAGGFSSMPLVAAAAFAAAPPTRALTVVMDAGRGEVFLQTFDRSLASREPVAVMRPAAAAAVSSAAIAGNGVAALREAGCSATIIADAPPDAASALLLGDAFRQLPLTPIYVRAPDAKLPA